MSFRSTNSLALNTRGVLARFWACDAGVNAIEFAFVAPIAIAIILATLQIGVIFIAQSYLETVAEEGARLVMTNQAANSNWTQAQFKQAICANVTALFDCGSLIVSLQAAPANTGQIQSSAPQFDKNGVITQPPPYQLLSAPSQMMLIVMYQWPVIGGPLGLNFSGLGNGNFLLSSTQVFQVETNNN